MNLKATLPAAPAHAQSSTFDILYKKYGVLFISATEAAEEAGWAASTIRNHIFKDTCPFPTTKVGGLRRVCLIDLAAWFDAQRGIEPATEAVLAPVAELEIIVAPKRRGRPPKVARVEAAI